MDELLWITKRDALVMHEMQLAEHGGLTGIRDDGLLESALARPENLFAYGTPDLPDLAAAYAFGLAKNHPFIDGNKRTSLGVCLAFLDVNGLTLPVADEEVIASWTALAAGNLSEAELARWLRARVRVRVLHTEILGEGEVLQEEVIERVPVPAINVDGWTFEGVVDGMDHIAFYTNHTRDDGETIQVVLVRLAYPPNVFFDALRKFAAERGVMLDDPEE